MNTGVGLSGPVVLAGIIALLMFAIGGIVVLSGPDDTRIGVIVSLISPTVLTLLVLLRTERTEQKVDHTVSKVEEVEEKLNGRYSEDLSHSRGLAKTRSTDRRQGRRTHVIDTDAEPTDGPK